MPIFGCASDEQLQRVLSLDINSVSQWQHDNTRSDKRFIDLLNETFDVESKCDFCNCAIKECQYCSHNGYHEDNEDGI